MTKLLVLLYNIIPNDKELIGDIRLIEKIYLNQSVIIMAAGGEFQQVH